ncbi:MAG: disulfide bond formation protein DsbA [Acidobacteria bacterium]|nr:disulfide bond formation protein DsbA [Acidobacteriota bacterium]
MKANVLEVYADIWCPFAHVGLRAAKAVRDERSSHREPMMIRAWPLELVNGVAMDSAKTADHVRELRAQVAPTLFAGFDEAVFPSSSLPALALVARAYDEGPHVGEAMSFAVRDALFERGEDISDFEVLAELAGRLDVAFDARIELDAVYEDWRTGQARGVKGSPHFFCANSNAFCPALDIERDTTGHLSLHLRSSELETFLAGCFRS